MRIEPEMRERLAGVAIGETVTVQYDAPGGALGTKTGTLTRITGQGIAVRSASDTIPIMLSWALVRVVSKPKARAATTFPNGTPDHAAQA